MMSAIQEPSTILPGLPDTDATAHATTVVAGLPSTGSLPALHAEQKLDTVGTPKAKRLGRFESSYRWMLGMLECLQRKALDQCFASEIDETGRRELRVGSAQAIRALRASLLPGARGRRWALRDTRPSMSLPCGQANTPSPAAQPSTVEVAA